MRPLSERHLEALAYGSVARGDVGEGSDIDVFVPKPPSPTVLEALIERAGIPITHREIVQATPTYAAKGYAYVEENKGYSFPLVDLRTVEREFYSFAGSVTLGQIEGGETSASCSSSRPRRGTPNHQSRGGRGRWRRPSGSA